MLLQRHRPARFFALVVLAFVVTGLWQPGFNRIETRAASSASIRWSRPPTAVIGCSITAPRCMAPNASATAAAAPPEPLTYFYFGGPMAEGIEAVRAARGGLARVAVVGLGTGSLACHKRGKEDWTFFEIDPEVVRIARDPRLFRFISACAPDLPVVLGDARLTLAASPQRYDLIILDAFSSDAIPVHLLTREALAGYLARLAPGGALICTFPIGTWSSAGWSRRWRRPKALSTYLKEDQRRPGGPTDFKMNAMVAALARNAADLGDLPLRPGWQKLEPDAGVAAWTDDYSDILGAILRKKLAR